MPQAAQREQPPPDGPTAFDILVLLLAGTITIPLARSVLDYFALTVTTLSISGIPILAVQWITIWGWKHGPNDGETAWLLLAIAGLFEVTERVFLEGGAPGKFSCGCLVLPLNLASFFYAAKFCSPVRPNAGDEKRQRMIDEAAVAASDRGSNPGEQILAAGNVSGVAPHLLRPGEADRLPAGSVAIEDTHNSWRNWTGWMGTAIAMLALIRALGFCIAFRT